MKYILFFCIINKKFMKKKTTAIDIIYEESFEELNVLCIKLVD